MNDLIEILRYHQKRYPLMQPQDVIKLLYQNEFGGGHLVKDKESSLSKIETEVQNLDKIMEEKIVPIGNGLIRVSLHTYNDSLIKLNEVFVLSSEKIVGSKEEFLNKINLVQDWIEKENIFNFTIEAFKLYLNNYIQTGCGLVSHSETYRENYHPSYRIVLEELL